MAIIFSDDNLINSNFVTPVISTLEFNNDNNKPKLLLPTINDIKLDPIIDLNDKYKPSINLSYTRPSLSFYEDLNQDPEIRMRLTKYYYYKILDKWLYDDMLSVLDHLKVNENKVDIVDDNNLDKSHKNTQEEIEKKVKYIENKILRKRDVYNLLEKFTDETGSEWINLSDNEYFIKKISKDYLTKKIKKMI